MPVQKNQMNSGSNNPLNESLSKSDDNDNNDYAVPRHVPRGPPDDIDVPVLDGDDNISVDPEVLAI